MLMRSFILSFYLGVCASSSAQKIAYTISMPKPQTHYFHVEMELTGFKEKELIVKMPVWAPGSYLVREFSKNVDLVRAYDVNGKVLKISKRSKNAWNIDKGSSSSFKVVYDVYSFELSVRTSFLDLSHGFISGSGVFMYMDNYKNLPGELTVKPYKDFKTISTSLLPVSESVASDGSVKFTFKDYDQLVDCPLEIGNQEVFHFMASGVDHTVAMYGEGNYDVNTLKKDMTKIVETATAVIGENPNKNYTFIIHNVVDGQGGLEHANSCTLSVNRWTYMGSEYKGFLSLVAHEYFHLWNVKRIRPVELGPFNYDEENYTSLLWVMEGFTSYYDELLLLRAGYMNESEFLQKLQSSINYVEGSVGARVQPVAHASFDAWIKAYRPTENSSNTTMTYYSRGQMLAAILDVMIVSKYKGQKCIDHFFQKLYSKFYRGLNRGFSEQEFQDELEVFLGEDMDEFFSKYVFGTELAPLEETFKKVGLQVEDTGQAKPSFGASLRQEGGKLIVRGIRSGSAAEQAGISVNDEIIGCNGYRIDQAALEQFTGGLSSGERFDLLISRDEVLMTVMVTMTDYLKRQFVLKKMPEMEGEKLRNYWLRTI